MSPQTNALPDTPGTVVPYLIIKGAAQAIDFYKQAFGAKETSQESPTRSVGSAMPRSGSAAPPSCWPTSIRRSAR